MELYKNKSQEEEMPILNGFKNYYKIHVNKFEHQKKNVSLIFGNLFYKYIE